MTDPILVIIGFFTKLIVVGMLFIIPVTCIFMDKNNDRKRKANKIYGKKQVKRS